MYRRVIYRLLTLSWLVVSGGVETFAQLFPIDANAVLIPPHSLQLGDYQLEKSQDFMVNLTMNDPVEPFWDTKLRVTISNNGVDILQTIPGFTPASPLRLDQFSTVTLSGFDIAEYLSFENLVSINGFNYTGQLPEGLNSICVEVLDFNRNDVALSRKACGSGYAILNDPPFPQLPICGETVEHVGAQNIMFTWLPMHIGSPNNVANVEYEFSLVKVEDGYNPYEAMEAAAPMFQTTVTTQSLVLQDPILEDGHDYAWQVRVVDSFGGNVENLFKNQGYSQVCFFHYQEHEFPDVSALYAEQGTGECSASCQTDIPTNSELLTSLAPDDVVKVGKFLMTVTEVSSSSGGFFNGKGFIFIPFLLSNLSVSFSDLTVNTDGVVFSGDVITDIDSDLVSSNLSDTDGDFTASADDIKDLNDYINNENRKISASDQSSTLGLPFAIDKNIGGIDYNIIITGINFDRDIAYLNAVMSIEDAESGRGIAFGSKGICFQPFGIGGIGSAELYLFEDFSLGNYSQLDLTFKAPGDGNPGSYVSFDCEGFVELNIEGEYEFPQNILESPDGSGPVTATFNINTPEWGQFITDIAMDDFEIHGVDGYIFSLNEAYLDYSDDTNPDDIAFPDDYGNDSNDWKGFYLSSVSVTLPEDLTKATGDLSFGAEGILIDRSGVSGNAFAAGLLDLETGRLSEWAFSLDTVSLTLVSNSLTEAKMLGQIHVPITDEAGALAYEGVMTPTDEGEIDIQFNVQPDDDITVNMWAADLSLSNSSVISVEKTSNGFTPYAELHGSMDVNLELQAGNEFSFEAMAFEGLKINHPDEDTRIAVDAFSLFGGGSGFGGDGDEEDTEEEDEQESLSGFPISFSNVAFEGGGSDAGINFDLNINLTGDDLGVGGTANMTVLGEYNPQGAPFNAWKFKSAQLSSIEVNADLAAGSIEGSVEIYKGDDTYGDGFKGLLAATFTGLGRVDALAQFGKVNNFRYFFVDAMVLSQSPFVDVLGVGLYGFGGGMSYRMKRTGSDPAMDLEAGTLFVEPSELGASLSGVVYEPNRRASLGLRAGLTMGIAPGTAFSADVKFEAIFGSSNGVPSIESIGLDGKAYMMSPGSILDREDSRIIGQFKANLDLSNINDPVFTAAAQMTMDTDVISGSGSAAMKLSKRESYMWIGTPDNPISISVLNMGTFNMYADMGDRVPEMPNIADIVPNFKGDMVDQRPADLGGTKVIFGASFGMDRQEFNYGSFYASAEFGLGFDAYLRQVNAADCGIARGNIGIDNWYLSGQAYAYGSGNVGLKVKTWFYSGKINILDLSASMVMQAELPNPTWISGDVDIRYSVLSGAIKGSVDYNFEIGEKCTFEENLVSGLAVLADISPDNGEREVYTFSSPTAICNIPVNEILEFEEIDDDGDVTTWQYMPYVFNRQTTLKKTNGANVSYSLQIQDDGDLIVLSPSSMLDEYTSYTATIAVKWKKRKKGVNRWTYFMANEEPEKLSVSFTTGKKPEFIPEEAVAYSFPLANRRNMYDVKVGQKWYVFMRTKNWGYLMEDEDYDYKWIVTNMETGEQRIKTAIYGEASYFGVGKITTSLGAGKNLNRWVNESNGDMFKVELKAIYNVDVEEISEDENRTTDSEGVTTTTKTLSGVNTGDYETEKIFRTWYFRMSDFDTPQEKIASYTQNRRYVSNEYRAYRVDGNKKYMSLGYLAGTSEAMDSWDRNDRVYYVGSKEVERRAIIRHHRTNYGYSGSISKQMWDRYDKIKDEAFDIFHYPYKKSMVDDNFWDKGDEWRDEQQAKFTWSKWDMFGNGKEFVAYFPRYVKDELTDAEKINGNADIGYQSGFSREYIAFQYKPEQFSSKLYYLMYWKRNLLRDDSYWYNFAAEWNPTVDFSKEQFMIGIRNWDADPSIVSNDVEYDIEYVIINN